MFSTAVRIRTVRAHEATEAERATFAEARLLQRRLRAATRRKSLTASRTRDLGNRLQRHRAAGFGPDLRWWLADYRATITADCRWSAR